MERKELSPMLSGWVGGTRERSEVPIGAVVVTLADVVPSDIGDTADGRESTASYTPDTPHLHLADPLERVWRWVITVEGTCTRSSTTMTDRRRDALLSATRFVEAAKRIVRSDPSRVTGTVAHATSLRDAPNGNDSGFVLHLELRDADPATIGRVYDRIANEAWTIGRLSQTRLSLTPHESNPSVLYDVREQASPLHSPAFSLSSQRSASSSSDALAPAQGLRTG